MNLSLCASASSSQLYSCQKSSLLETLSLEAIRWLMQVKGWGSCSNSLIYSSISSLISAHWETKPKYKLSCFWEIFLTVGFLLHEDWMKPQSFFPVTNHLHPLIIISGAAEVIFGGWIVSWATAFHSLSQASGMAHSPQEWLPCYGLLQLLVQGKIAGSDERAEHVLNSDISGAFIHSRILKLLSLKF